MRIWPNHLNKPSYKLTFKILLASAYAKDQNNKNCFTNVSSARIATILAATTNQPWIINISIALSVHWGKSNLKPKFRRLLANNFFKMLTVPSYSKLNTILNPISITVVKSIGNIRFKFDA